MSQNLETLEVIPFGQGIVIRYIYTDHAQYEGRDQKRIRNHRYNSPEVEGTPRHKSKYFV